MELTALDVAVIEQLGHTPDDYEEGWGVEYDALMYTLRKVCRGSANEGWYGFTYYKDTVKFYEENKKEIVALAKEVAENMGEHTIAMVQHFNCLCDWRTRPAAPEYSQDEIAEVLYGPNREDDTYTLIANALAWFALEKTARKLTGK